MHIVELNRMVSINNKSFAAKSKLAVSDVEFDALLDAGAIAWVDVPFAGVLPEKYRNMSWFELRSYFIQKVNNSRAKDEASFCERYGLPHLMLKFLRIPFSTVERSDGTDH
jgi:hypothetical protein